MNGTAFDKTWGQHYPWGFFTKLREAADTEEHVMNEGGCGSGCFCLD